MTAPRPAVRMLPAALFGTLLAASVAVAGVALHARSPDLALEVRNLSRNLSPNGDGIRDVAHIRFFVRESDANADVEIVGDGEVVRTLARNRALVADRPVRFRWNGHTDSGELARPGNYHLRVVLPEQDRDMVYPIPITLSSSGDRPAGPTVPHKTPRDQRTK